MVKFKSRYILLEIITISTHIKENLNIDNINNLTKNINKFVHNSIRIKTDNLANKILTDTKIFFGELDFGKLKSNFQVKYLNSITNLVIIRVGRENCKMLETVLLLINKIDGKDVKLRILHISGTIKKLEEKAKEMLSNWISNYEMINNNLSVNSVGQKCLTII